MGIREDKDNEKETSEKDTEKETDDSSEDEEQDDSQGDDSEEQDNDKQDEEEDSDEEEQDITKQYFTDPEKLDPDPDVNKKLKGGFKRMQGTFTRELQKVKAQIRKVEVFDALAADPEFRNWIRKRQNSLAKGSTRNSRNNQSDDDEDDSDEDAPITRKDLRREMQAALNPLVEQTEDSKRMRQARILKKEARLFKRDNPDWETYKEGILARLDDNPKLTYQEAYDLESREDDRAERRRREIKDKRNANINKPNNTGAKSVNKKPQRAKSIAEAFERAASKLGWKE